MIKFPFDKEKQLLSFFIFTIFAVGYMDLLHYIVTFLQKTYGLQKNGVMGIVMLLFLYFIWFAEMSIASHNAKG
jgi:hypothetical protein